MPHVHLQPFPISRFFLAKYYKKQFTNNSVKELVFELRESTEQVLLSVKVRTMFH